MLKKEKVLVTSIFPFHKVQPKDLLAKMTFNPWSAHFDNQHFILYLQYFYPMKDKFNVLNNT